MDEVKDNENTSVSVTSEAAEKEDSAKSEPDKTDSSSESPSTAESNGEVKKEEPAPAVPMKEPDKSVAVTEPVKTPVTSAEKESELVAISGLLLVALAGAMFYVGTVVFAKDSLLFFTGIFVYLLVAPPGTYVHGKSKMASFTKEVAVAFGLTFLLFLGLKALPNQIVEDQAKFFTIILTILGVKLVFYPYYNFKADDD